MPRHLWKTATLVLIAGGTLFCGGKPDSQHLDTPPAAVNREAESPVPYMVVKSWRIPAGGNGRVLVVNPRYRNEADLKRLGDLLRREAGFDRYAFVQVYDDEKAAKMRDAALADSLGKTDLAFHDDHLIAFYNRNRSTGFEEIQLLPEGFNGRVIRY